MDEREGSGAKSARARNYSNNDIAFYFGHSIDINSAAVFARVPSDMAWLS